MRSWVGLDRVGGGLSPTVNGGVGVHAVRVRGDDLASLFDEDADLYDRARPGYPPELFADLGRIAGLGAGSRVLEIGPGTGQATRSLCDLGLTVTAVERGPSLAATLRQRAAAEVVTASFETWPLPAEPFDAVTAFTAWHWVDPEVRGTKTFAALRPGGALATVTTTHVRGGTASFFDQVQGCYERWDPATRAGLHLPESADVPDAVDEVDRSPLFRAPVRTRHQQDLTYSTTEYIDLLMTYSGHRSLPRESRSGLLACVAELINSRYGGTVTKRYLHELRITTTVGSR